MTADTSIAAPPPPKVRVSLGVTGHRATHPTFAANQDRIAQTLVHILDVIDAAVSATPLVFGPGSRAATRLHCLLADGADQLTAEMALSRQYELVAPLPFGERLNTAINAMPVDAAEARALLAGEDAHDPATRKYAEAIRRLTGQAQVFDLADEDESITALFLAKLNAPNDTARARLFAAECSRRVALADRILIEQSDIVIAVWDGVTTAHVGGTGHTLAAALDLGALVVWIDPAAPAAWRVLRAPESLVGPAQANQEKREAALAKLVRDVLHPGEDADHPGIKTLDGETWRTRSNPLTHAYRRIEALFGDKPGRSRWRGLTQHYESPDDIASGSAAGMLAAARGLPGADAALINRITHGVLKRFAWSDGISAHLSDLYRGGMVVSFILSSLAIVGGMAYLPFVSSDQKWAFALFEFVLLSAILAITFFGQKTRWHDRWFETRRVAEYLRHSPLLMTLGAARAPGRWPQGAETSWPEFYVRHALRDVGLPQMAITPAYLRGALTGLLGAHVVSQRSYHFAKAKRLTTVHHKLDRASERLFQLAVLSVTIYLALRLGVVEGRVDHEWLNHESKIFTVLGVLFPTFGAGIAGIRYFGDFERFAAISQVTAEKLDAIHRRIELLAAAPDSALHYGRVAELAHATDDVVFAEIENWQAVFGGKHISVPV